MAEEAKQSPAALLSCLSGAPDEKHPPPPTQARRVAPCPGSGVPGGEHRVHWVGNCRGLRDAVRGRRQAHLRGKVRTFRSACWAVAHWGEAQDILGPLLVLAGATTLTSTRLVSRGDVGVLGGDQGSAWRVEESGRESGPGPPGQVVGGAELCGAHRLKVGNRPGPTGEGPGPAPSWQEGSQELLGHPPGRPPPSFPCGLAGKAWARPAPWSWQGSKGRKPSSALTH